MQLLSMDIHIMQERDVYRSDNVHGVWRSTGTSIYNKCAFELTLYSSTLLIHARRDLVRNFQVCTRDGATVSNNNAVWL